MEYGLILDLETTGLDPKNDRIIEIGLLEFALEAGQEPKIMRSYSALEDPGVVISPTVQKVTGISPEMVIGQTIDWPLVRRFLERSEIIVAHNAAFDRSFIAERPELSDLVLHWGCSLNHIQWAKHGFKSRALNYLACDHGFINPFAHRALFDCATTFRLIGPYVSELVSKSYESEYKVLALGAAFAKKELLRDHGYHWEKDISVWTKTVFSDDLEEERLFLRNEIYEGEPRHEECRIN